MKLDESQQQKLAQWLDEGLKVADVQNRLASELGVRLTYMEVRFLMDDLRLKPRDAAPPAPAKVADAPAAADDDAGDGLLDEPVEPEPEVPPSAPAGQASAPAAGQVSVSVDKLTRPGTVVSGQVTFSDGQAGEWYLDQMGRLGLMPRQKGYKPPAADIAEFQRALQNELARMGF
jgi:hypothetical protein